MESPRIIKGGLSVDDRGCITFCNDFNFKDIKRFYMVENHEEYFIRAFHGHKYENKYVFVTQGDIKVVTIPIDHPEPELIRLWYSHEDVKEFYLSSKDPKILYIPAGYYNGFQTLTKDAKVMFFSTSTLEESLMDDIRQKWDFWPVWNKPNWCKYR